MVWQEYLFKPSSLITMILVLSVIVLTIVALKQPTVGENFYEIISSLIKILAGALAGSVAGENYAQKVIKSG